MKKYNKPEVEIIEINTQVIASLSNPIVDGGDMDGWGDGIIEEFNWED